MTMPTTRVRVRWRYAMAVGLGLLAAPRGHAQRAFDAVSDSIVRVDLSARSVTPVILPFGQPFVLRGKVDPAKTRYLLVSIRHPKAPNQCYLWRTPDPAGAAYPPSEFVIDVGTPLQPAKSYTIEVLAGLNDGSLRAATPGPATAPAGSCRFWDFTTDSVKVTDTIRMPVRSGGTGDDQFKVDIGYMSAGRSGFQGIGTSVHIYSIPVNRATDLKESGMTPLQEFRARVSVSAGLVVLRLDSKTTVQPRVGIGAPMIGAAIRSPFYGYCVSAGSEDEFCLRKLRWLLQPMRIGYGAVLLQQTDPNPIIDRKRSVWDTYWSISYDLEFKSLLVPFTTLLGK